MFCEMASGIPGVEEYLGADLLWRRGQHVEVVEGALVAEAADVGVADHLLVALHPPHHNLAATALARLPVPPCGPLIRFYCGFLNQIDPSNFARAVVHGR